MTAPISGAYTDNVQRELSRRRTTVRLSSHLALERLERLWRFVEFVSLGRHALQEQPVRIPHAHPRLRWRR